MKTHVARRVEQHARPAHGQTLRDVCATFQRRAVMRAYVEERREILAGEGFDVDRVLAEIDDAEPGASILRRFVERVSDETSLV